MKKEVLRMQDVCVGNFEPYGLNDFCLHICEGEMVNVIGLSGAGKTMIYEYFMGYIPLRKGKVIFDGKTSHAGEYFGNITDVICIGKGSTLISGLSVAENIFIITGKRKVRGIIRMKNIYYRAKILLAQYAPELSPYTLIRNLTPLQMIIVEMLRVIENEAKLIIIDDVFQGYGQNDLLRVTELLGILKEKKVAIIYGSHEMDFTRTLADKTVVLRKGKNVRTFYQSDYSDEYCRKLLIGNEALPSFSRYNVNTDQEVLQIHGLSGERYVENFSMKIHKGEIIGLYDLNNQKNMEILQMIIGEAVIKNGWLYLKGERYEPTNLEFAIKNRIGYIPRNLEGVNLVESMNFADNLCLPVLKKTSYLKIFRNKSISQFLEKEYMQKLGVPYEEKGTKVKYFDEYIKNSILLTRWILFHPVLMVCMEPCGNADMVMQNIIFQALSEMAESGIAVLIASQNMNELKTICDKVYVLDNDEKKFLS